MVRCIQPDPRVSKNFTIGDPACGTGGFLVAAYEWLKEQTGGAFDRDDRQVGSDTRPTSARTSSPRPRRLALMNLYLHQVEPHITLGDSIYEVPTSQRFDVILTNPPFGTKGANQAPVRDDFVVETSNKQLNFLQHVLTHPQARRPLRDRRARQRAVRRPGRRGVQGPDGGLRRPYRAALPSRHVRPYTDGTKTNVLFFTKGEPTEKLWIYDARANVPTITKKCSATEPRALRGVRAVLRRRPERARKRAEADSPDGRWRSFTLNEINERGYKIDSFKWLRDEELDDPDEILDAAELVTDAIAELQAAISELHELQKLLDVVEAVP